jgi:hypothetical protein
MEIVSNMESRELINFGGGGRKELRRGQLQVQRIWAGQGFRDMADGQATALNAELSVVGVVLALRLACSINVLQIIF